ncbi:hypothetical protein HA464_02830 [Rhizobium leguminosarum bv. trifolii]|uniref:hypothetical protein n=1 Tax=Rhizobium TaxID=379 RepID=UPI0010317683|nr:MULTISPECIES: hypothetical protein [Rhizobium]QIO43026.1 hypothetical protein HA464_02830 [Rhizobium leguminosarum bv. trifolii]TAZ19578.1 hypothetical protein ELH77_12825 [Rhizobium ruizarguesonis]TBC94757.1 hypothetical protein ELH26_12320 [Rhizobium leguminosarum]
MHAATRFTAGALNALRDVTERRAQLIQEIREQRGLSRLPVESLIDLLTIGSFDDCCCGSVSNDVQQRIVGWPTLRLRENVKRELRARAVSDQKFDVDIEDAFERGFDLAVGKITVDTAWRGAAGWNGNLKPQATRQASC